MSDWGFLSDNNPTKEHVHVQLTLSIGQQSNERTHSCPMELAIGQQSHDRAHSCPIESRYRTIIPR